MSNAKLDSDLSGSSTRAKTDVQEPNVGASEVSAQREMAAIASKGFRFRVDGLALREAFLATRFSSAGSQVRMRIFQDHLTLVSQKKGMRCEG